MILDTIENVNNYKGLSHRLDKVLDLLLNNNHYELKPGKNDIDKENIFLLKNEYRTEREFAEALEAHKKYLDVQLILEGEEIIEWEFFNNHEIIEDYNEEHDYSFFKPLNTTKLRMSKGKFCVFFPNDLHMPGIKSLETSAVKKVVYKVLID